MDGKVLENEDEALLIFSSPGPDRIGHSENAGRKALSAWSQGTRAGKLLGTPGAGSGSAEAWPALRAAILTGPLSPSPEENEKPGVLRASFLAPAGTWRLFVFPTTSL